MADLIFYTNPMSRGQIIRWALEEIGAPYHTEVIDFAVMKDPDYLAINPMGKVPAVVHNGRIVTECAAICAYLADAFPDAGLGPKLDEKADYYRWLFFAAGPIEAAVTDKSLGLTFPPEKSALVGYGSFDKMVEVLDGHFKTHDYVCGSRFTIADVYVGSQVLWGLQFGSLTATDAFTAYAARLSAREAYIRAKAEDMRLIGEAQAAAPAEA